MSATAVFALLCAATGALRAADRYYYRDHARVLRMLRLLPRTAGDDSGHARSLDAVLCWFPFTWIWCDIAAVLWLGRSLHEIAVWLVAAVFVGGRFRALQEVAHTAVHSALCRSRSYQWAVADLMVSWPLFRPDVHHRYIGHVTEHHPHANEVGRDPNISRFVSVGVVPGITVSDWRRRLLFPLTPRGLAETVRNIMVAISEKNVNVRRVPLRLLVAAVSLLLVRAIGGGEGLLVAYALPLTTVYPLFSWLSVLAEHRWFANCDENDRKARECVNGRPTDYQGVLGTVVKHLIFPFSDHYHLAHSLYPSLRWNHLAAVDRALKATDARYGRYASMGLFRSSAERPSALSELRDRLVDGTGDDLADWARDLVPAHGLPQAITV